MASILANVNRSDLFMDNGSGGGSSGGGGGGGGSGGGGGGGGGGSSGADNGANYSTSTSPAIWFSYNSSGPTNAIENSNASRHFADHPETSGAVGIEAVIIVVVVSLIPVSVIACMVFVISFNCLKKRSSLWSTTASPNTIESNTVANTHSQVAYDCGGGGGGGGGRRKSAVHSVLENENLTNTRRFAGENDNEIAMIDTPLSLIYPADAFSAYMDTSKSNLTTPISSNSVITMTMRNNHLIVETEERIPCSLLDGQHLYAAGSATVDGMVRNSGNFYVQCQVEEYEPNDDSLFDDADSFCENRYCQHSACGGGSGENGCAFCGDGEDDDDGGGGGGGGGGPGAALNHHRDHERDNNDDSDDYDDDYNYDHRSGINLVTNGKDGKDNSVFYDALAKSARTTTAGDNRHVAVDEEDQHVEIFHKNIAAVVAAADAAVESSQPLRSQSQTCPPNGGDHQIARCDADECRVAQRAPFNDAASDDKGQGRVGVGVGVVADANTGYSQSDAHGSSSSSSSSCSRFACSDYAYRNGNQSEYDVWTQCARNKRFPASSSSSSSTYITSVAAVVDTCSKLANANANMDSPRNSAQASSTDCLPLSPSACDEAPPALAPPPPPPPPPPP